MPSFGVSPRKFVLISIFCYLATPCLAREATVVQSVAHCNGGVGTWSDASIWTPMQVPDNGKPAGTTYEVSVSGLYCFGVVFDVSFTVDQLDFSRQGYWDGAKDKAAKVRADSVSIRVLRDAWIRELVLTNAKLEIGGTAWPGHSDGWFLTDSKLKAGNYFQDGYAASSFDQSSIQVDNAFTVGQWTWSLLDGTWLQTGTLDLVGALRLRNGARVQVGGDYHQDTWAYSSLGVSLGDTDIGVNGDAYLSGNLWASLSEEGTPAIGREFTLLRCAGTIFGTWTDVDLPQLPPDRAWSLTYGQHAVTAKVVPAA